jgi:hypothetical protein
LYRNCLSFQKKVVTEFGWKKVSQKHAGKLFEILKGEVETMNTYLEGNTYGITVTNLESEETNSCWGYLCPDRKDLIGAIRENVGMFMEDTEETLSGLVWQY